MPEFGGVAEQLRDKIDEGRLLQALIDATTADKDLGEPSWSSIGWTFATRACRRCVPGIFMKTRCADRRPSMSARALVSGHPYAGILYLQRSV